MNNKLLYSLLITAVPAFISCESNQGKNKPDVTVQTATVKKSPLYNDSLATKLAFIYENDQQDRRKVESTLVRYGMESLQMDTIIKLINKKDAANLISVKAILDKYGWLGDDVVGETGRSALFLVIQHADQKDQEHYLPGLRIAVKEKKALAKDLALMEDRVALGKGKKQIYGTQFGRDNKTGKYFLRPLTDPDHVEERRAKMDLPPIADALSNWRIKWNPEDYK